MTQNDMILQHLKEHKEAGITPLEAINDYGIMRLASRINELRKDGYQIETNKARAVNRFGKVTGFARYVLAEEE